MSFILETIRHPLEWGTLTFQALARYRSLLSATHQKAASQGTMAEQRAFAWSRSRGVEIPCRGQLSIWQKMSITWWTELDIYPGINIQFSSRVKLDNILGTDRCMYNFSVICPWLYRYSKTTYRVPYNTQSSVSLFNLSLLRYSNAFLLYRVPF